MTLDIHCRYDFDGGVVETELPGGFHIVVSQRGIGIVGFSGEESGQSMSKLEINISADDVDEIVEIRDALNDAIESSETRDLSNKTLIFGHSPKEIRERNYG